MTPEALERKRARSRAWNKNHPDAVKASNKRWRLTHPETVKTSFASWCKANPDKVKANQKRRQAQRTSDPEKRKAYLERLRSWRKAHPESERMRRDPNFKIKKALRARTYAAIKGAATKKYASTMELLGCTVEEVRKHIESLWEPGMSWDNHGLHGWHIDHIRPCSSFDLTDPEQQKQCFHWTNLQPLWATDNISKRNRWKAA